MSKHSQHLKCPLALVIILAMLLVVFPSSTLAADYDNHWAKSYIDDAKARGWVTGYEDGSFRANDSITRAEFAVMLWRALGEPAASGSSPFNDVAQGDWYHDAVVALHGLGVVNGIDEGQYGPATVLTREMAMTMLARAFGLTPSDANAWQSFSDADSISDWARAAVSALSERGYVSGSGANQCTPGNPLTRGEMAKLLISTFDGEKGGTTPVEPVEPGEVKGPEIKVSYSTETASSVTVTVTADGASYIGQRSSKSGASYDSKSGFSDITSSKKFTVKSNGWYAVCATDKDGNFSFKLFEITNIKATSGGSGGSGGGKTTVAVTGVTINGTAAVGETLTTTLTPTGATNVSYQWYSSANADGTDGQAIDGATKSTYDVKDNDLNKYLYVIVKGDSDSKATSAVTAKVAPALISLTYTATADGSTTATTTKLTLKFSPAEAVSGLSEGNIQLTANGTGAAIGALTAGTGGEYELSLGTITKAGTIGIKITAPTGYKFASGEDSKNVTVYQYTAPVAVSFSKAEADGTDGSAKTTKVTLTFDKDITGLTASEITLTDTGGTGATKGNLTKVDGQPGTYDLALTGITKSGTINLAVSKTGYTFTPTNKDVSVVFYAEPVVTVTRAQVGPVIQLELKVDGVGASGRIWIYGTDGWTYCTAGANGEADISAMASQIATGNKFIVLSASVENSTRTTINTYLDDNMLDSTYAPEGVGVYIGTIS